MAEFGYGLVQFWFFCKWEKQKKSLDGFFAPISWRSTTKAQLGVQLVDKGQRETRLRRMFLSSMQWKAEMDEESSTTWAPTPVLAVLLQQRENREVRTFSFFFQVQNKNQNRSWRQTCMCMKQRLFTLLPFITAWKKGAFSWIALSLRGGEEWKRTIFCPQLGRQLRFWSFFCTCEK
jgi:hypothetical protein